MKVCFLHCCVKEDNLYTKKLLVYSSNHTIFKIIHGCISDRYISVNCTNDLCRLSDGQRWLLIRMYLLPSQLRSQVTPRFYLTAMKTCEIKSGSAWPGNRLVPGIPHHYTVCMISTVNQWFRVILVQFKGTCILTYVDNEGWNNNQCICVQSSVYHYLYFSAGKVLVIRILYFLLQTKQQVGRNGFMILNPQPLALIVVLHCQSVPVCIRPKYKKAFNCTIILI